MASRGYEGEIKGKGKEQNRERKGVIVWENERQREMDRKRLWCKKWKRGKWYVYGENIS